MKASVEHITPSKAEQLLNRNTINRKLREGVVEKYASDMRAGLWTECTAPIAFYEDGELADGQHRLFAIVESGKGQTFPVIRGIQRVAGLNIDTGFGRTLLDNARISGRDDLNLSHNLIATARVVENRKRDKQRGFSNAERVVWIEKHQEAARWAIANGPQGRSIGNALVWGAIARAYYHEEDKERLEYFGRVIQRGFSNGEEDSAGVSIRNYLQALPSQSAVPWDELFLKVQNAIWYFMRKKRLTVIKRVEDERYPLPKGAKVK